jgi:hypothetical protein
MKPEGRFAVTTLFEQHCALLLERLADLRDEKIRMAMRRASAGCGYDALRLELFSAWTDFRAFNRRSILIDELVWA